jgi:nucleoside-diphosphate-sugar epimerase
MMENADILMLGASGKVGRLMRAHWPGSGLRAIWQGRRLGAAPGWTAWQPGQPLPAAPVVALLAGVTAGPPEALAENTRIGLAVAQAALQAGARHVLLFSTMAIYGRTPDGDATEAAAPDGPNAYGLSKLAMEQAMAKALAGSGTGLTALRIGNVAGADLLGDRVARGLAITLDRFADGQGPLRSYAGPGLLVRVVRGLASAVLDGRPLPAVLNVAGQRPVAMADLMQAAGLPFVWTEAGPNAIQRIAMDCRALAALVPPVADAETAAGVAAEWKAGTA